MNCWLPWKKTLPPPPKQGDDVFAVIPTAGRDIPRLLSCICSIRNSSQDISVTICSVVCPSDRHVVRQLTSLRQLDKVITLDAPFNYCQSVNAGIEASPSSCTHLLIANDDILFTGVRDVDRLVKAVNLNRWACAGPWILYNPDVHDPTRPQSKSSLKSRERGDQAKRTNAPVSGSCMMWRREWFERVGLLDVRFGEGYGMDEADLCYRTLRRGGRYGRQDRASIWHEMHGTFTLAQARYDGEPHQHSLQVFKEKHGKEVEQWGRSVHWYPLPGLHVLVDATGGPAETRAKIEAVGTVSDGLRTVATLCVENPSGLPSDVQPALQNLDVDKLRVVRAGASRWRDIPVTRRKTILEGRDLLHERYPAVYPLRSCDQSPAAAVAATLHDMRNDGAQARPVGDDSIHRLYHVEELRGNDHVPIFR